MGGVKDGFALADGTPAVKWAIEVGPIGPPERAVRFVKLSRLVAGIHRVEVSLINEDLPDGRRFYVWSIQIPETGDQIELQLVETESDDLTGEDVGDAHA